VHENQFRGRTLFARKYRSPQTQSYWSVHSFRRRAAWENRQPRLHKRSLHGTQAARAVSFGSCPQFDHGYFTA